MTATAPNPGITDGIALEKTVLTRLKGFIDGVFTDTETATPKLVGDEVTFAEGWLKTHATGYEATIVDGVLAFGGTQITQAVGQLGALAVAQLTDINKTIDTKLALTVTTSSGG